MSPFLSILAAAAAAACVALLATPAAIRLAAVLDFYDRPREYRRHARATPFLGGAAVLVAVLVATLTLGGGRHHLILLAGAVVMWIVGTVDDRYAVAPRWRVLIEALTALGLGLDGAGWHLGGHPLLGIVLSVVWVVALVNAFNLMDNMDGACASVGATSAAGIAVLAALAGAPTLAAMAAALLGACAGFLRFNLAGPARIFLGDGGSMPVGFLVAALAMSTSRSLHLGAGALLVAAMTAGVVILDTSMVSLSRRRRGVPLLTGGRDHLTHRLLRPLGTPRRVALGLASVQATLCAVAILSSRVGPAATWSCAVGLGMLGAWAVLELDRDVWRPAGIAYGPLRTPGAATAAALLGPIVEAGPLTDSLSVDVATRPGIGRITGRRLGSAETGGPVPRPVSALAEAAERAPSAAGVAVAAAP